MSKGAICAAVDAGCTTIGALKKHTRAASTCGGCAPLVTQILKAELKRKGVAVDNHLCEHFPYSRQQLFPLIRVGGLRTFEATPRQARTRTRLRHLQAGGRLHPGLVLERVRAGGRARLTAGHQRLLPRQHAEGRHLLRRAARARRRDHAGKADRPSARSHASSACTPRSPAASASTCSAPGASAAAHLGRPDRRRLRVRSRLRQGDAHREILRRLDLVPLWRAGQRRSRHRDREPLPRVCARLTRSSSPCPAARASAPRPRARTSGVIATEKGWNLYVCGNGGMKPRHAELLAAISIRRRSSATSTAS